MDDPEAPKIGRSEVRVCPSKQTNGIKGRNRKGGEEEQPGHIAHVIRIQAATKTTEKNDHPKNQADRKQNLPEATKIKVLKTLSTEPGPSTLNPTAYPGILSSQTSEHDDRQGCQ